MPFSGEQDFDLAAGGLAGATEGFLCVSEVDDVENFDDFVDLIAVTDFWEGLSKQLKLSQSRTAQLSCLNLLFWLNISISAVIVHVVVYLASMKHRNQQY